MNINDYRNHKLGILRDYFKAKISKKEFDIKESFKEISKEPEPQKENIKYRSSSPWYVLLNVAKQYDHIPESTANDNFLCGFKFEDEQYQIIVDASFSKAVLQLSYLDMDEYELINKIKKFVLYNRLHKKSLSNFVRKMKNMHPGLLYED